MVSNLRQYRSNPLARFGVRALLCRYSHVYEGKCPKHQGLIFHFNGFRFQKMRGMKWRCLESGSERFSAVMNKVIFFLSVGRNALIVLTASLIAFSLNGQDQPFTLTGDVTPGLPPVSLPPFSTTINNQVITKKIKKLNQFSNFFFPFRLYILKKS